MNAPSGFTPPLNGTLSVPGDKSIAHRALLLGALAEGDTIVRGFPQSADCLATLRCLRALGLEVIGSESDSGGLDTLVIRGRGAAALREPEDVLDAANSGTALRLLAGLVAGLGHYAVLSGDSSLRRRPMGRIVEPLSRMGAAILGRAGGQYAPLAIRGGGLRVIDYTPPVASAQVKSAILLAGLLAEGVTVLREPVQTRDHTERMLSAMGAPLRREEGVVYLWGGAKLSPLTLTVPGDISSAAFFLVAASLVPGSEVRVMGVGVNPTRTGILDVLESMGADIRIDNERYEAGEPVADITARFSNLRGVAVDGPLVPRVIDEVPVIAVAATQAIGKTTIRGAAELRVKESDRIAALASELSKLGASVEELPDGLVVNGPTQLHGALVRSHGDHRIAMALAVAGLITDGEVRIEGQECVGISYPGFFAALLRLREEQ